VILFGATRAMYFGMKNNKGPEMLIARLALRSRAGLPRPDYGAPGARAEWAQTRIEDTVVVNDDALIENVELRTESDRKMWGGGSRYQRCEW